MNLDIASFTLLYNGKDITEDVSDQVLSIEYNDKIASETDELNITLEDTARRWQNAWYPEKGAALQLYLRDRYRQLNCGVFNIDEIELAGSQDGGDVFTIRAVAASFGKKMRSLVSRAHENKSLREIANTVAAEMGLTVQGTIRDIRPQRTHQYRETNLAFLNRLANRYGYYFSVRDNLLIFTHYSEIEGRTPSVTLKRSDLITFNLKDSSHMTYKHGRVRYHSPNQKETIDYSTAMEEDDGEFSETASADDLQMYDRVEDKEQAQILAEYGLHDSNSKMVGGDITIQGNLYIVSGNNIELQGLGRLSGIFTIGEARHNITRDGGYQTSAELKRVKLIDKSLYK